MAGTEAPKSYSDPYYASLAADVEKREGLPSGLLSSIINHGEKSNADQVSEKGARTVAQIIPPTRKAALEKYGVDAYLSPENALTVAGKLLKESLQRNDGDTEAAIGEYHAGTNRDNWGPRTQAYIQRVSTGLKAANADSMASGFAQWMAANPAQPAAAAATPAAAPATPLDQGFSQWFGANRDAQPEPPPAQPGIGARLADVVTGKLRETEETKSLPEWTTMPELNEFSAASAKSGLGTLLAPTAEIPKILQAQYPGVKVRHDAKGNPILRSSINGKEYAIPPGLTWGDLPRALGAVAAFTPASTATTLPGLALAGGATQAVIEGTQAATGGEFNPGDVVGATVLPAVASLAVRGTGMAANALRGALTKPEAATTAAAAPLEAAASPAAARAAPHTDESFAADLAKGKPMSSPEDIQFYQNNASDIEARLRAMQSGAAGPATASAPVTPMAAPELAQTARAAAKGNGSALETLASQAAPDAETVAAAKRLGIEDHLQPDHVTMNQAYRELAQAVKSIPGSQARASELEGLQAVAKRADDLVTQIGGADDVADLGVRLKGSMLATQKELEDKADQLYSKVREQIPLSSPVKADGVLSIIKQRAEELGGVQNLSPMEKKILARLTPKASTVTEAAATDPEKVGLMLGQPQKVVTQTVKQPTYALLDDVRRDVGAVASRGGPFKDADTGLAKRLYSAIANDQLAAAEAHGAADTYRAAQAAVKTRKGLEDDLVAIFGKALDRSLSPNLASATGKLAAGDTQGLARLIQATPASMRREVVASGLQYAFNGGAKKQAINFPGYARWYEGLRKNAPAYNIIAQNLDAESLKHLNDLYKVSKGIAAATRERITTGRINAVTEELKGADTLAQRIFGVAKKVAAGVSAEAVTSSVGLHGAGLSSVFTSALVKGKPDVMKAADAVISSPEFLKLVAKYQRTGVVDQNLVKRLSFSKAMKDFARQASSVGDLSDRERFILSALQGSREREGGPTAAIPYTPTNRAPESRTVH